MIMMQLLELSGIQHENICNEARLNIHVKKVIKLT